MTTAQLAQPPEEVARLARGEHQNRYAILGTHPAVGGTVATMSAPSGLAASAGDE